MAVQFVNRSVTLNCDRQLVFADRNEVISAGNFHGEYPAKVCYMTPISRDVYD